MNVMFKSTPFSRRETIDSLKFFFHGVGLNPLPSHEGRRVSLCGIRYVTMFKSTPFSRRETGPKAASNTAISV